jgi:Protein of unknown function (DUF3179)
MRPLVAAVLLVLGLVVGGCSGGSDDTGDDARPPLESAPNPSRFPPAPSARRGPLAPEVAADLEGLFSGLASGVDRAAVRRLGRSDDARVAWLIGDLLRFVTDGGLADDLTDGFEQLTRAELPARDRRPDNVWKAVTDRLIDWDLPAPPGYVAHKERLFTLVEPRWAPFFRDRGSLVDWRRVSWGGVLIDDRPLGDPNPCLGGCIPALDDPAVTPAAGGSWYPDDATVFGVVVNGRARAYPKNVMEVHELVNDTLGGRRIGLPYCTLCGAAQAYFTDRIVGRPLVLRTSGLLSRSNKVMYELQSKSVFDTFTGRALSGPLRRAHVRLQQITVVTSTWGGWKDAHPDTTIVAQDGGIGRSYPADPLRGRDAGGPIFPIGTADPRLPVQEQVVGVIAGGRPVAFPAAAARAALRAGEEVELAGVRLRLDGEGLRAELTSGAGVVSHQAFWFAWSQFHPATAVWSPVAG